MCLHEPSLSVQDPIAASNYPQPHTHPNVDGAAITMRFIVNEATILQVHNVPNLLGTWTYLRLVSSTPIVQWVYCTASSLPCKHCFANVNCGPQSQISKHVRRRQPDIVSGNSTDSFSVLKKTECMLVVNTKCRQTGHSSMDTPSVDIHVKVAVSAVSIFCTVHSF